MTSRPLSSPPLGDLAPLLAGGTLVGLGDGTLLDRVAAGVEPAAGRAFEALVRRYWPVVARVAASILGDRHLAEDASQAVFLVLHRRAGAIRQPERLASWLHGVALRTARAARRDSARRRRPLPRSLDLHSDLAAVEEAPPMPRPHDPAPDPAEALLARERAALLHDAIARLPERDRAPVVLCELEGLTHAEAASRLGCPTATVGVRLMRARQKLRDRLSRRGVNLDAALAPSLASAAPRLVPPRAAFDLAASATLSARRLADRALRASLLLRAQAALLASVLLVGGAVAGAQGVAQDPAPAPPSVAPPAPPPALVGLPQAPVPKPYVATEPVLVVTPTERIVTESVDFIGHLAASRSVTIRATGPGTLVDAWVVEGTRVAQRQALFQVGSRHTLDGIEQANAALRDAEARLAELQKWINMPDRDPAVRDAEGVVQAAREARRQLNPKAAFGDPISYAPFAGVITQRLHDVGEDLHEGRTPLATLIVDDPLRLDFEVDEQSYLKVRRSLAGRTGTDTLPIRVALADEEGYPHTGRVRFQTAQFDPKHGTCTLHAEVPNPDHNLIPGLFTRVRLEYGTPTPVLLVPRSALLHSDGGAGPAVDQVAVVDEANAVHRQPVQRGGLFGGEVAIMGKVDTRTRIVLRAAQIPDGAILKQPIPPPAP